MKDFCKGRVIAVFGCGGDRDPMKRPIMGHIGVKLSDFAVITSDNPRTEDPMAIIRDILTGVKQEDGEYIVIEDRRAAIRYAMDIGKKDDIIVLARKGHETYQDIGGINATWTNGKRSPPTCGKKRKQHGKINAQTGRRLVRRRGGREIRGYCIFRRGQRHPGHAAGAAVHRAPGRDGHDFIQKAMDRGAAAALCSRKVGDYPAIYVDDPRIALGQIAREELKRIGAKVVAVTGSVGKSTTKEMVAAVLEQAFVTSKTPANHNNDIGMPMAVLAMPENTEVAVLEMGMNHFGEISYLSQIARPDVAVIINIGTAHIEFLGTQEGIRQAKMEIVEGMTPHGMLLLNGDDFLLRNLDKEPQQRVTYFGSSEGCAVRAFDVNQDGDYLRFRVEAGRLSFPVGMLLEGEHYVNDALAAVTVGLKLGVLPEKIQAGLSQFRNISGRQEIIQAGGMTIIKDCYNAGPESMSAALAVLGKKQGRRIAVLGDMLELGDCTQAEHYRVGRIAAEKADYVFAYGPNSGRIISGTITGGMPEPGEEPLQTGRSWWRR